jgi:hypothetical protein
MRASARTSACAKPGVRADPRVSRRCNPTEHVLPITSRLACVQAHARAGRAGAMARRWQQARHRARCAVRWRAVCVRWRADASRGAGGPRASHSAAGGQRHEVSAPVRLPDGARGEQHQCRVLLAITQRAPFPMPSASSRIHNSQRSSTRPQPTWIESDFLLLGGIASSVMAVCRRKLQTIIPSQVKRLDREVQKAVAENGRDWGSTSKY